MAKEEFDLSEVFVLTQALQSAGIMLIDDVIKITL